MVPDGFMVAGDKSLTSDSPTRGPTLVDRNSSIRVEGSEASAAPRSGNSRGDQELSNISMLENGLPAGSTVSEEDPAGPGSYPRPGPASQGEVKSSLHTESAEQVCSCLWLIVLPFVTAHGNVYYSRFYAI